MPYQRQAKEGLTKDMQSNDLSKTWFTEGNQKSALPNTCKGMHYEMHVLSKACKEMPYKRHEKEYLIKDKQRNALLKACRGIPYQRHAK